MAGPLVNKPVRTISDWIDIQLVAPRARGRLAEPEESLNFLILARRKRNGAGGDVRAS